MAREFPASKTQIAKATELGLNISDNPGYTTLGSRLEVAGWTKDGKREMDASEPALATMALESMSARKTPYQMRQERKAARQAGTAVTSSWHDDDEDDEGREIYRPAQSGTTITEDFA